MKTKKAKQPKATAVYAPPIPVSYQELRVSEIIASRANPRKACPENTLRDLAQSIQSHGLAQPIVVRPLDNKMSNGAKFELVAGERRWRAFQMLGFPVIPSLVGAFTDELAREVQLIENLHRADLSELEEADGYSELVSKHGYTVESLAATIHRSKSHVYGRLKLSGLCPMGRGALNQGKLLSSVAEMVARLPDRKLQEEALDTLLPYEDLTFREARNILRDDFMRSLNAAPFDKTDPTLQPSMGPCTTCPHRTGSQPELFNEADTRDHCLQPECYQRKVIAHGTRVAEAARAKGLQVVQSDKVLDKYGGARSGLVKLSDYAPVSGKAKTWAQALGKAAPGVVVAVGESGEVTELVEKRAALAALKDKGVKLDSLAPSTRDPEAARSTRKKLVRAVAMEAAGQALPHLFTLSEGLITLKPGLLKVMASAAYQRLPLDGAAFVAKRRQWTDSTSAARDRIAEWLNAPERTGGELLGFLVEALVLTQWSEGWSEVDLSKNFVAVCQMADVDCKVIEGQLKARTKKGGK